MLQTVELTRCPACGEYFAGLAAGKECLYCKKARVEVVESFHHEIEDDTDLAYCPNCGASIEEVAFDVVLELEIGKELATLDLDNFEVKCPNCGWVEMGARKSICISADVFWDPKIKLGKVFIYDDRYRDLVPAEKARIYVVTSEEDKAISPLEDWQWRINDTPFGEDNAPKLEDLADYILIVDGKKKLYHYKGIEVPTNWELLLL